MSTTRGRTRSSAVRLPAEHIPVLADPDDVRYEAHTGVDIVRAGRQPAAGGGVQGRERAATASMGA